MFRLNLIPSQVYKTLLIGLLFSAVGYAEQEVIGPFGGLNNADSSYVISSNQAQDLLNVDISDGAKSVKRRKGYATAFTLSNSTSPLHGVYNAYDTNGADFSLFFNDRMMSVSVSGGSPTVFFSTGTNGATYQCVDSNGFAYCANTARDAIIKVNSSTYTLLTGFTSTGTMVAVTPERLVQAGFSTNPNAILFSKSNDFTTWTLGGNPTDPIQFTIVSPGSGVKHITFAHGRVYWFKDSSFGYILEGNTQADWRVKTISSFLGSLNNTSIYRDEILYFQGNDGHFYAYDGSELVKLSKDIQATIDLTQGRTSNSWSQSSQSDFSAGILTNLESFSNPGQLTLAATSYARIDFSTDTAFECQGGCTQPFGMSQPFISTRQFTATSVTVKVDKTGSPGPAFLRITSDAIVASSHTPTSTVLATASLDTSGLTASSSSLTGYFSSSVTLSANTTYWVQWYTSGTCDGSNRYDMQYRAQADLPSPYDSVFASCGGQVAPGLLYWFKVNEQTVFSSGTYASAVHNSPSLTAWDSFGSNYADNGGSHSFSIRSSTGIFYASATTIPTWSSISAGSIPSISTNPYFQIRDILVAQSPPLVSPILYDFTQNWFEGGASDKSYAIYHDNANWWSVASGTGASSNNKILKFNLLNPGWYIYDIGMAGMYVRSQALYFGSVSSGKIFKFGDSDSDDGSSITAYWKSKDFFGSSPFLDKDYTRMSSVHSTVANSSMTVTYTIDGSSSTSYNVNLGSATSSFIQKNVNLPQGKTGKTINVKFGNSGVDQPWETYGAQVDETVKSWVPK